MLVTSGTASIGSKPAARAPRKINRNMPARTSGRFFSEKPTISASKRISLLLFAEGLLEHGALQREHAFGDDVFALAQPAQDLRLAERGRAERDLVPLECAAREADEDDRMIAELGDRGSLDDDGSRALFATDRDARGAEQSE